MERRWVGWNAGAGGGGHGAAGRVGADGKPGKEECKEQLTERERADRGEGAAARWRQSWYDERWPGREVGRSSTYTGLPPPLPHLQRTPKPTHIANHPNNPPPTPLSTSLAPPQPREPPAPATSRPSLLPHLLPQGVGRATALVFARKGYNVVVAAREPTRLQHVVDDCAAAAGRVGAAMAVPCDITNVRRGEEGRGGEGRGGEGLFPPSQEEAGT